MTLLHSFIYPLSWLLIITVFLYHCEPLSPSRRRPPTIPPLSLSSSFQTTCIRLALARMDVPSARGQRVSEYMPRLDTNTWAVVGQDKVNTPTVVRNARQAAWPECKSLWEVAVSPLLPLSRRLCLPLLPRSPLLRCLRLSRQLLRLRWCAQVVFL